MNSGERPGHRGETPVTQSAFKPGPLSRLAPFDLFAEVFGDLQPDGFQRMIAGGGVDVRARHGQMHVRAEGGRAVPLPFQHDFGGVAAVDGLGFFALPTIGSQRSCRALRLPNHRAHRGLPPAILRHQRRTQADPPGRAGHHVPGESGAVRLNRLQSFVCVLTPSRKARCPCR